ncbi:MAG TPA: hypothetical protein VKB46_20325 [Pyrinomonadaceae bacterium]|nr:hypothetical protein [Pyrinomonadaceae bacterium]
MKKLFALLITFGILTAVSYAQEPQPTPPTQQPTAEELEKKTSELSKNAYRMLDQVIDEAQNLHLTENRVHVQIIAADALWERNPDRARQLFALAAEGVTELMRNQDNNNNGRQNFGGQGRRPAQVRAELLLTVARHDAQLAYQLLASTKPPVQAQPNNDQRNPRGGPLNNEDNLEQSLLSQVASLDPKFAAQNADQMLEKGQFPRSLTDVIAQLQRQDKEAAAKLTDKTLKRLGSTNLLANNDASTLALGLLAPGPRIAPANTGSASDDTSKPQSAPLQQQVLEQSAYTDLMGTVVDFALKATPQPPQTNQRPGPNQRRGFGPNGAAIGQTNLQTQPTDAQIEQANARRLLTGLQAMLPQMDQYVPARAQSVRQKMAEVGITNQRESFAQAMNALQSNANADALVQAAESAPPQFQPRLYQQAALKALDEGNSDRARQIATDHLQNNQRDAVLQKVDFKEMAKKAEGTRLDEIKQNLARMRSDNERVDALLQMSADVQSSNPKLARQLLEEARQMTNKRVTSYDQFEQQLKVAHAFAAIEPARSFEVLDPGISQLNELISAAALLNGFEVNMFRDGELPLQSGNGLTNTVSQYGEELALLAKTDFARSESLAGRFQLPEARTLARLAIIEELLGSQPAPQVNQNPFRFVFGGQNFNVIRQNN